MVRGTRLSAAALVLTFALTLAAQNGGKIGVPFWVSVQVSVSVSRIPGSVTAPVRLIVPEPTFPALSIRTVGGALFTTINLSTEVVLTSSDTDTWIV